MEIYLIRHTTPAVEKGTCYGFADIGVADTFTEEASRIRQQLPDTPLVVYASPLQRCVLLARFLFGNTFITDHRLKELNFGEWEMQRWDDLGPDALQAWMNDYVHTCVPGGESYTNLYDRSTEIFREVVNRRQDAALVAHSGVIRSILAHVTNTPLEESFDIRIGYGHIARITVQDERMDIKVY